MNRIKTIEKELRELASESLKDIEGVEGVEVELVAIVRTTVKEGFNNPETNQRVYAAEQNLINKVKRKPNIRTPFDFRVHMKR